MSDLSITAEWVEAEEIQGAELQSTWCALSIRVGDAFATRVLSGRARTVRNAVFVSAYPLAEWLATSWWLLLEQRENPDRFGQRSFQETHCLRFARDGYALPDLTIVSLGDTCRLKWMPGPLGAYEVEFLSAGSVTLPTSTVRAVLSDFVDQVVARLLESGVEGTLLQQEWRAIQELENAEVEYCAALASVGLDPFSADADVAATVVEAYSSLPLSLMRELSAVTDGSNLGAAALTMTGVLHELDTTAPPLRGPAHLRAAFHPAPVDDVLAAGTPWARGYADARALRAELGLNGAPIGSLEGLAELLGEDANTLHDVVRARDLHLGLVNGVTSMTDEGAFTLQLAPTHPRATLFHLTRALGSYLFSGARSAALTKASSDAQARFRAFAAEFLAPASGLRTAVSGMNVDQDAIDELAAAFGVSPFVIHHQLQNHNIAETSIELTEVMPDA
jgi:hypothetical protein